MTTSTNTLANDIVRGVRGVTAEDRPSHVRLESADGRQIALLVGRKVHVPATMAAGVELAEKLQVSGGRHVLVVDDKLGCPTVLDPTDEDLQRTCDAT